MTIIQNVKLTRKRAKRSDEEKTLIARHPGTINAVLSQANSIEEFKVLRDGLALSDTETSIEDSNTSSHQ